MKINIHTHKNTVSENEKVVLNLNLKQVNTIKPTENLFLSYGIHPWDIETIKHLDFNFSTENLFAIGEIGLDKSINTPFDLQKEVFIKQIKIANKSNLPIIIHCVKAVQEIISIKKEYAPNAVWIYHGFNKNLQIAEQLIKNNFLLSFGKDLFNNKSVIAEIPQSKILLETDDSDYSINDIYIKASSILNINIKKTEEIILNTFLNLVRL